MAMVKADAYGHGLLQVAQSLTQADGLAVARLEEALLLRKGGVSKRILLLATLLDSAELALCSDQCIDVTAHDEVSVARISAQASSTPLRVWLKLDTGMHRVGLDCDAFLRADQLMAGHPGIVELIHMTHFSCADDAGSSAMERQLSYFWKCRQMSSKARVSLANSAALIRNRDTHADWVRPGIMLYGVNPLSLACQLPLRQAMTLRSRVIAIRVIPTGEAVGYNRRWISERVSRIATVGVGYGDGYPRHARNGTPVWINGHLVPLVGQVSMDSLAVDVTEHEAVRVGDDVVLWGPELPVAVVAECAGTIGYHLFTSLQPRVARNYISSACS
jgi:alanine racemase